MLKTQCNIKKNELYDGVEKKTTASVASGIILVVACVVGGGMFALPTQLAGVWFLLATLILIAVGVLMLYTGLMLLEVNLLFKVGASFDTFTEALLGRGWKILIGITLGFVLYILTYAYISGFSGSFTEALAKYFNIGTIDTNGETSLITKRIVILAITIGVSAVVWVSSIFVSRLTTILVIGKFLAFFMTFAGLTLTVDLGNLFDASHEISSFIPYIWMTFPVCIISFGFHGNVPSMVKHFGYQPKKIAQSIYYGMIIVILLYIFWLFVTMGNLGRTAFSPLIQAGGNLDVFVRQFSDPNNPTVALIITFFVNFAVAASLLAATLGLFDYIADLCKFDNSKMGRLKTAVLTYFPPGILCCIWPNGFITAIAYAGVAFTLWSIILPPLLVMKARASLPPSAYRAPINTCGLITVLIIGVFVYVTVILDVFGYLPIFKG